MERVSGVQMRAGPTIEFVASDVYDYFRPSRCELRVWLRRHGEPEASPTPFVQLLRKLGDRHERRHFKALRELGTVADLRDFPREKRFARTLEEIRRGTAVIYQGSFTTTEVLEGVECRITGSPDFLIRDGDGYRIRDSKLARRVGVRAASIGACGEGDQQSSASSGADELEIATGLVEELQTIEEPLSGSAAVEESDGAEASSDGGDGQPRRRRARQPDHPEILRQLELYGWLFERCVGRPPVALEVHTGTNEIVELPYDGGRAALELLARMLRIVRTEPEPWEPVGWSKCQSCGYRARCWPVAVERKDVSLVRDLNERRARALAGAGVLSIEDLLLGFDAEALTAFSWMEGEKQRRFGNGAEVVLRNAWVLASGEEVALGQPTIPPATTYVMFDLEGLPPYLDEVEKIYLWGLRVFGDSPGEFLPALADFGEQGDRAGWQRFLAHADAVLRAHGDVPFVHWGTYERTKLDLYVKRYGDPAGVAARVRANLLDLCRVLKNAVVLPLSSYSLKEVEQYVGFERRLPYAGDLAMAEYIEAVETRDRARREEIVERILEYNAEDLEATWAVLQWLRSRATPPCSSHAC